MVIFYFLMIMPAQRRQKKTNEMLKTLKNGDKVITNGGIYGTIVGLEDDTVQLRIAEQVKIKLSRSAIVGLQLEQQGELAPRMNPQLKWKFVFIAVVILVCIYGVSACRTFPTSWTQRKTKPFRSHQAGSRPERRQPPRSAGANRRGHRPALRPDRRSAHQAAPR